MRSAATVGLALLTGCASTAPLPAPAPVSLHLPVRISLAADASTLAYSAGDSLWVMDARTGANRRLVTTGMTRSAESARPFQALSRNANRLAFQLGNASGERAMLATLGDAITLEPLLPDSLAERLMLFQHFAAGGPSWSPDGNQLAFLAADRAAKEPLQLWLRDISSGDLRRLHSNGRMHYSVAWSPDGARLALAYVGEQPGTTIVALIDASGSSLREIDTLPVGYATDLLWAPDASRLALFTAHGMTQVYDLREPPVRLVQVRGRFAGWRGTQELLGARRTGMSAQLTGLDLTAQTRRDLSGIDTLSSLIAAAQSTQSTLVIYTQESGSLPREIWSATAGPEGIRDRRRIAAPDRAGGSAPWTSQVVRWRVDGEHDLEAKLLLPRGKGPFPLIVAPYGAYSNSYPDANYFLDQGWLPLIRRGYAIVFPNTRGPASEQAMPGAYGQVQLDDTERLISRLASAGTIIPTRAAVLGHSHGASLAYFYATHSRAFCASIAINGRADWEAQARQGDAFLELNMGGPPDSVPEAYRRLSPVKNISDQTAPVLAVTGVRDTQIYPFNGRTMVEQLTRQGRIGQLLEFPDEDHMIASPANQLALWTTVFAFLERHCGSR